MGCTLLPGGVHPWMDPSKETRLWPHEYNEVYRSFDRIFGCAGHGWSNLQSTHLNLPFADDDEFGRLHAAIRAILPLLPALNTVSLSGVLFAERFLYITADVLGFVQFWLLRQVTNVQVWLWSGFTNNVGINASHNS